MSVAVVLIQLVAVANLGAGSVFASETMNSTRDLPLPTRWNAHYLNDPVFDSRVYVVEAGRPNGPPVLLVHGLGQSGYQDWWEVIQALETEYHVIAMDLPGFARSSMPDGEFSPARYARFLDWLIQRLELSEVNLVGHSLGAAIALYHAGEYPSRVTNVVLIDAAGVLQRVAFLQEVAEVQVENYKLPSLIDEYKKHLFNWGGRLAEQFMIQSQVDVTRILRRSDSNWNVLLSDQPNINAAVSLLDTDFSRVLSRFDRPVTIIWGGLDGVTPIRTGHLLHGRLPTSALHVIEGAGHAPMRTHTGEFVTRLRRALARPPETAKPQRARGPSRGNLYCRNERGETVSGVFDRIVLDRCPETRLVNVSAETVTILESPRVQLRNVEVKSDHLALDISRSNVTATNVRATGDPAVRVDNSRLDLAGGTLESPDAALRVARRSTVILSVSRVNSVVREGTLHGAVIVSDTILDNAPNFRGK